MTDRIEKLIGLIGSVDSIRQGNKHFYGPALDEIAKAARAELAALREENKELCRILVGLKRSLQSLVEERPALAARMGSSTTIGNHLAEAKAVLGQKDATKEVP